MNLLRRCALLYAAQTNPQIDAETAKKAHFGMNTEKDTAELNVRG
jgi:hypothetical protein